MLAHKIGSPLAVRNLYRRVFPNLAYDEHILALALDTRAKFVRKIDGQFVHDVESPTLYADFRPLVDDAVVTQNQIAKSFRALVDGRHDGATPPARVFVGIFCEIIPVEVRRLFALVCAQIGVRSLFVEILAVRTRVVKHAVEHNFYALFVGFFYEIFKLFFRAEQGIYFQIIPRIVAVIRARLEHGRKVNQSYAERLKIIEFRDYTLDIAAEKVVRAVISAVFGDIGAFIPVGVQSASFGKRFVADFAKPVGKYLIGYALFCPNRRFIVAFRYGQLPFGQPVAANCRSVESSAEERQIAVCKLALETILPNAPRRKRERTDEKVLSVFTARQRQFVTQGLARDFAALAEKLAQYDKNSLYAKRVVNGKSYARFLIYNACPVRLFVKQRIVHTVNR